MIALLVAAALAGPGRWEPPRAGRAAYAQAVGALDDGRYPDARRALDTITARCGACGATRALALAGEGRHAAALEVAQATAMAFPEREEAWIALWFVALAGGDAAQATAAAEGALALRPEAPEAWGRLVDAHLAAGTGDAALEALAESPWGDCFAVEVHAAALRTREAAALLPACEAAPEPVAARARLAASGDPAGWEARVGAASRALAEGRPLEAEALAEGVLAALPGCPSALYVRAGASIGLGRPDRAEADLLRVAAAGPWRAIDPDGRLVGAVSQARIAEQAALSSEAAALLAELRVARGDLAGAREALAGAGGASGAAAEARLRAAEGDLPGAWALIEPWAARAPDRVLPVAADLAARDPAGPPAWAESVLTASGDPRATARLAVALYRRGSPADCAALATEADAALGHACAVAAGDLLAADAFAAKMGAAPDPRVALAHAALLREAGRPAAGLARLDGEIPEGLVALHDSLAVLLHADRGDGAAAVEVAQRDRADPQALVEAAGRLHGGGDHGSSRALLKLACPRLEGAARRACEHDLRLVP